MSHEKKINLEFTKEGGKTVKASFEVADGDTAYDGYKSVPDYEDNNKDQFIDYLKGSTLPNIIDVLCDVIDAKPIIEDTSIGYKLEDPDFVIDLTDVAMSSKTFDIDLIKVNGAEFDKNKWIDSNGYVADNVSFIPLSLMNNEDENKITIKLFVELGCNLATAQPSEDGYNYFSLYFINNIEDGTAFVKLNFKYKSDFTLVNDISSFNIPSNHAVEQPMVRIKNTTNNQMMELPYKFSHNTNDFIFGRYILGSSNGNDYVMEVLKEDGTDGKDHYGENALVHLALNPDDGQGTGSTYTVFGSLMPIPKSTEVAVKIVEEGEVVNSKKFISYGTTKIQAVDIEDNPVSGCIVRALSDGIGTIKSRTDDDGYYTLTASVANFPLDLPPDESLTVMTKLAVGDVVIDVPNKIASSITFGNFKVLSITDDTESNRLKVEFEIMANVSSTLDQLTLLRTFFVIGGYDQLLFNKFGEIVTGAVTVSRQTREIPIVVTNAGMRIYNLLITKIVVPTE